MADYRKRVDPPAQYKNMLGDRSEKPMSVQMAEVGVEFTPAGTIFGLNDIKKELQKEEPDYYKIGMMAGVEAIGLIPGLDKVAIEAIKAGAKRVGLDKVADQTDVLLGGPKAGDSVKTEIIAGPGAKTYYNRDYDRAKELKEQGYSAAQIEDITGRVETGESTDYLGATDARYSDLKDLRDDIKLRLSFSDLSPEARQQYEKQLLDIEKGLKLRDSQTPGGIRLPENPFKFEIDDSRIEIRSNDGNQTLKESTKHKPIIVRNIIPTHTELFKEYPDLEYVEFYVDPDLGTGAHFNPTVGKNGAIVLGSNRTDLSRPNSKKFRNTFFHELQHAAQYQDYKIANLFQLGGSPTKLGKDLVRGSKLQRIPLEQNPNLVNLRDEILEIFEAEKGTGALDTTSPGFRLPGTSPNPAKVFGDVDVAKKLARKMRELESELFKSYMRSASETEARLAGRRGQEIATVGSNTKPRITSDLAKERRIETKDEFWSDNPKSDADKKKADIKIKLGPMTNEEVLRYATGAINFARYAKGIDKELQGFSAFGPTKPKFAKGGAVNNMSMKQQMSLFEYGGIADDGMTKDPVSGNNIPPGSLAKEVRDDIPAMLSEGEYVVPADVLRYYGVNFFENLRGQAKQGLQNMEQNGRIGGTPMTQQDVARNMQQPMMAPAPVQAAQGAMMQSPMRIQQQPAPQAMGNAIPQQQPIMANRGTMVQGFDQGTADPRPNQYRSGWSPARARYNTPMFQGTSSQQVNIAAAQEAAQEQAATEEITQFRKHYNQAGESVQIKYIGTSPDNMSVAPGQEDLLSQYPLTEEEWLAYKKEMSRGSGGDDGGGEDPVSSGSDVGFLEGIDYTDQAKVQAWADERLGLSKDEQFGTKMGGLLFGGASAISQARDIAEVRAMAEIQRAAGNTEFADKLDAEADKAVESGTDIISAFDKLGFMTGDQLAKQGMKIVGTTIQMQNAMRGAGTDSATMTSPGLSGDTAESRAEIAKEQELMSQQVKKPNSGDDDSLTHEEIMEMHYGTDWSDTQTAAQRQASEEATGGIGSETGGWTPPGFNFDKKAKGGLMTAPKPKKKTRKYNKGGLAGKKK